MVRPLARTICGRHRHGDALEDARCRRSAVDPMGALIVDVAWGYTYVGLGVAALFLTVGIGRVSPDARGAYAFRPLLVPGIVLLWPAVLWRWFALERGAKQGAGAHKPPRRVQDGAALALAVLVPLILLVALVARQDGPLERAPVQLAPPAAEEPGR